MGWVIGACSGLVVVVVVELEVEVEVGCEPLGPPVVEPELVPAAPALPHAARATAARQSRAAARR